MVWKRCRNTPQPNIVTEPCGCQMVNGVPANICSTHVQEIFERDGHQ